MRKGKFGWVNAKPSGKGRKAFTQSRKGYAERTGKFSRRGEACGRRVFR